MTPGHIQQVIDQYKLCIQFESLNKDLVQVQHAMQKLYADKNSPSPTTAFLNEMEKLMKYFTNDVEEMHRVAKNNETTTKICESFLKEFDAINRDGIKIREPSDDADDPINQVMRKTHLSKYQNASTAAPAAPTVNEAVNATSAAQAPQAPVVSNDSKVSIVCEVNKALKSLSALRATAQTGMSDDFKTRINNIHKKHVKDINNVLNNFDGEGDGTHELALIEKYKSTCEKMFNIVVKAGAGSQERREVLNETHNKIQDQMEEEVARRLQWQEEKKNPLKNGN